MLKVLRPVLSRILTPTGHALARMGVTPNVITVVGTIGVVGGALGLYPRGELFWGTVLITVFVLFDMLDGAVARVTGGGTVWGAFLDSTLDRVADAAIFAGLILWLAGKGDDLPLAVLALYCLISGALVSYAKARAEGLGLRCDVGVAERGERILVALVGAGLDGLGVPYALVVGLWLLAAASTVTVAQRIVVVRRQALAAQAGVAREAAREGDPRP
ncbi:MAG TPA: CDP-alcohol phosphatidyltransferase family protein [Streptosporangiaceae bacterium]|nr:CDP-alcohol phosphatidyltransferase family protein [Streptosporangiaceae bacterium]